MEYLRQGITQGNKPVLRVHLLPMVYNYKLTSNMTCLVAGTISYMLMKLAFELTDNKKMN